MKIFCIFTSLKIINVYKSENLLLTILNNSLTALYGF